MELTGGAHRPDLGRQRASRVRQGRPLRICKTQIWRGFSSQEMIGVSSRQSALRSARCPHKALVPGSSPGGPTSIDEVLRVGPSGAGPRVSTRLAGSRQLLPAVGRMQPPQCLRIQMHAFLEQLGVHPHSRVGVSMSHLRCHVQRDLATQAPSRHQRGEPVAQPVKVEPRHASASAGRLPDPAISPVVAEIAAMHAGGVPPVSG